MPSFPVGGIRRNGADSRFDRRKHFSVFHEKSARGRIEARDPEDVRALCAFMKENGILFPLAHAPYIYNPATADERIREYTLSMMKSELEFLESIPGSLYNFHPGAHVKAGSEVGCRLTAECLNTLLTEDMATTVLIETMSGKGTEIGVTFEEIRSIIAMVNENVRDHVGVCLDTCHISDGGYDIAGDPDRVLTEFDCVIGLDRLKAVHLNDSKNPVGRPQGPPRKDRRRHVYDRGHNADHNPPGARRSSLLSRNAERY